MRVVIALLVVCLMLVPATGFAAQWLWEADNHTGSGSSAVSDWVDGTHQMYCVRADGGWDAYWDDPSAGIVTVKSSGNNGRYLGRTYFNDCNNPLDAVNYWDMYVGITVGARIFIPSFDDSSGNGSLCISVANDSTVGLIDTGGATRNNFTFWWGWDMYESGVTAVNAWTRSGGRVLADWIIPSTEILGVWSDWTIAAQRVGNTIYWDLWINGVHEGATFLGDDGKYHTFIGCKDTDMGTSINYGQRRTQPFQHTTSWDWIGVTNDGVIAGWDGASPVPEPSSLLALAGGFAGLTGFAIRRRR